MTITALLAIVAFVLTIAAAVGKCPLWVPVLLLSLIALLQVLPLR
jgi:hypothetical protein